MFLCVGFTKFTALKKTSALYIPDKDTLHDSCEFGLHFCCFDGFYFADPMKVLRVSENKGRSYQSQGLCNTNDTICNIKFLFKGVNVKRIILTCTCMYAQTILCQEMTDVLSIRLEKMSSTIITAESSPASISVI